MCNRCKLVGRRAAISHSLLGFRKAQYYQLPGDSPDKWTFRTGFRSKYIVFTWLYKVRDLGSVSW